MVIYKETVFTIILTIGLLATVWLIVMRRHPLSDTTSRPEETANLAGIANPFDDYLK
jgi:hypothetical protein